MPCTQSLFDSLPEFMDFILFGKTILVVNKKFGLFLANQLRKRVDGGDRPLQSWVLFGPVPRDPNLSSASTLFWPHVDLA